MSATRYVLPSSITHMLTENSIINAQLYFAQLLQFPNDIQDNIIDDISNLPHCTDDAITAILYQYAYLARP